MKTTSENKVGVFQKIARFPKLLVFAGVAALMALPMADARPKHHRGGDRHHHRSEYRGDRHYGHRHHHHAAPRRVDYRGWSRPGFYGSYPPAGYVDYRYIHSLPRGYRTVYRGGHRYYYANGAYYWPATYRGSGIYINVRF